MKLKKSTKILLGIATVWPIVYMFLFVITIFGLMLFLPPDGGATQPTQPVSPFVPISFIGLFAIHLFTMLVIMGLMAFYIVRVFKTEYLDQAMKIMWTVLICMLGMFAMPVFWYLYIWREPPVATAVNHSELPPATYSGFTNVRDQSRREGVNNPQNPPDWR
ncbi:MAG: hypothetical protein ACREBG_28690 [Pyrinomonadaceae bacterium]